MTREKVSECFATAEEDEQKGRYSSLIHMKEVLRDYDTMMALCKGAISQCEETIFSDTLFEVSSELLKQAKIN